MRNKQTPVHHLAIYGTKAAALLAENARLRAALESATEKLALTARHIDPFVSKLRAVLAAKS